MATETRFMSDAEEARLFLMRYPRLTKNQIGLARPSIDGKTLGCVVPVVRDLIGKHVPGVVSVAVHLMTAFGMNGEDQEPRLLMEYFPRGHPDPDRVPPIFFSVGAREVGWAGLLVSSSFLAFLDGLDGTLLVRLQGEQTAAICIFLKQSLDWCRRQEINPFDPGPFL